MKTEKENQHYVPKFYLRKFSCNDQGKQIGIYNIDTCFYFPTAPLRHQGSKSYFYGEDGILEDLLSETEGHQARLLRKIIDENFIPQKNTSEHVELITLLLLTQLRNPKSAEYIDKSFDNLTQAIYSKSPEYKDIISDYKISITDPIGLSISALKKITDFCLDLDYKLIVNNSKESFITSDNPLIKYNQFLEANAYPRGSTGFGNLGFQMFFPLNSTKMIIFYDPICYKVGSKNSKVIETKNKRDIEQLNILHFLNCNNTVFFNEKIKQPTLQRLHQQSLRYTKANEVITKEFPKIEADGKVKENSTIIMTTKTECKTKLDLTFIKLTDKAKYFKVDRRIAQIRPFCHYLMDNHC